jgi:hypothetical protein
MDLLSTYKVTILLAGALSLSACGGGGSDDPADNDPVNQAPNADAGVDQSVDEMSAVTLDGSMSSDPDGDTLTYAWDQTGGTAVTLSATDAEQPTFDAPDVTALNTPETLTFELTVSDQSIQRTDTIDIVVNDVGLGINSPPTADAGPDQTVAELSTVTLDGRGSMDPDDNLFTYAWLQTSGTNVVLSDPSFAQPTFTSFDVAAAMPETLMFELTVDDGSDFSMDSVEITVVEGLTQVTVAGTVSYEWVPTNSNGNTCTGLNFAGTIAKPIRAATVQLLDEDDNILGEMVSDEDNGSYSFADIDANTNVRIRVRAELKRTGVSNWDVDVRDNVDTSGSPPALGSRPLYVTQWPLFSTGVAHISDADFTATTGWGGTSYTGNRTAAPFAILDTIYTGMQFILAEDPTASFPPLDAFWSINNTATDGSPTEIDLGELGGSFYFDGNLLLMGDEDVNTGEFDYAVTLHEWGHYFEDTFSRSDSIGGTHFIGEAVEARVSFSEGWGTAFAAMAWGDPMACNTGRADGPGSWGFNVESFNSGPQGWYNELSVASLLLDLYDVNNDGPDNSSIGFGPIYDVMTGPQVTTEAFTTLFSFATLLRPNLTGAQQGFLDTLLSAENVETTGLDVWASNQGNIDIAPNNSRDVLPLYTDYAADGSLLQVCTNSDHDAERDGNKPAETRYLRITTNSSAAYDVSIAPNPIPPPTEDTQPPPPEDPIVIRDRSDPDMYMFLDGILVAFGNSPDDDLETFTTQELPAGVYVADVQEWRYADQDASSDYPERICFDLTMTAQ